jgi:hypothetical protein
VQTGRNCGYTYLQLLDIEWPKEGVMSTQVHTADGVVTMSADEYDDMFDRIARKNMGIPGAEFLRRWDAGEFEGTDWDSIDGLRAVAMALPLAR